MNHTKQVEKLIKKYSATQLKSVIEFGEYLLRNYPKAPKLDIMYELELYQEAYKERRLMEAI